MSEEVKKAEVVAPAAPVEAPQKLTEEQKGQALRFAHSYFSNFERVPGFAAAQWAQALDAIGLVINSLVAEKASPEEKK